MSHVFLFRKFFFSRPKTNHIIALLTLTDIFTWGTHLVLTAIVGIYLSQRIGEDAVQIVGIGTAVYMTTHGILQLPIGKLVDMYKTDTDEILILIIGSSYLFYPLITSAELYYALQFVFAVGAAMNLISWKKLFAQNLDKNAEGVEYGEYGLVMGLSTALFGLIAGSVANISMQYFNIVIVSFGVITMLSSIFGVLIFRIKKRKSNLLR